MNFLTAHFGRNFMVNSLMDFLSIFSLQVTSPKWKPCHCSKNLRSQCKSLSGAQKTTLKAKSTKRPYQFAQGSNFTDIFSSLYPFLPNRTSTTLWGIFWDVKNSNQNSVVFIFVNLPGTSTQPKISCLLLKLPSSSALFRHQGTTY